MTKILITIILILITGCSDNEDKTDYCVEDSYRIACEKKIKSSKPYWRFDFAVYFRRCCDSKVSYDFYVKLKKND